MVFDYTKEYREFYYPKSTPSIVILPSMNYLTVRGKGSPLDFAKMELMNGV
jgi:hypothetical protein